jgi:mannose-1-phosphate guanylyltransferase
MLVETVRRLRGLVPSENVIVVTGKAHAAAARRELSPLGVRTILAEPEGRNTAACVAWGALEARERRDDAVTLVVPADHTIQGTDRFRRDMERGFALADARGVLVTFGVKPDCPATGYGYIRAGRAVDGAAPAREVDAFVEKPNRAKAATYVASGKYFWNSGIFVWRADTLLRELSLHLPRLVRGLESMAESRRGSAISAAALARGYGRLEAISIDHGLLEKSEHVAVLPVSFGWSDVGSWDAMERLWPADRQGNVTRDPLVAVEASGNVVATAGKPVVLVGVDRLVVVDAGDALLVCPRERSEDVRAAVARLAPAGLGELL